jgi:tetratricopeptide repeat protein
VLIALAAIILGGLAPLGSPAQNTSSPPDAPANQIVSVTLARGVQADTLFGQGAARPVEPTTTFINTDLPYAVVKVKALVPDTTVTLRLADPTGASYSVDARGPQHKNGPWQEFDFAAPLYILGTDLEGHTGTWRLQVLINGQMQTDTTFQWGQATPLALSRIRDAVDESPLNSDLHWRYGSALALLGHTQEATSELESAIHLAHPPYALYHISLGRLYERQGRYADAVREFQAALALHGSSYDAVFSGWARAHLAHLQAH